MNAYLGWLNYDSTMYFSSAISVMRSFAIACLLLLPYTQASGQEGPVVKTPRGYVQGIVEKGIYVFKGVPYAAPPTGALRFKAPQPVHPWKDTLPCIQFGPVAAQYAGDTKTVKGDENCLQLNIYTPSLKPAKGLPILVWVHGGGMTGGSGIGQNGHSFSHNDSIITITINYRLGVFGFLYLNDVPGYETAGNNALLDCIMAMKWIRENIKAFGGDPSRVTLIGESAGAKLISSLLVTPAAKGYFRQLILESGAVNCIRDTLTAKAIRKRLMDTLGISSPAELLQLPTATLITAQDKVLGGAKGTNYFGPAQDGILIKEDALRYVRNHPDKNIRVLLGTNKAEALLFMNLDKRLYTPDSTVLSDWFGDNYKYSYKAWQKIHNLPPDTAAIVTLSRYMYQLHTYRLAKALAAGGCKTWMYSFEQPNKGAPATHGEELQYVWYEAGHSTPHNIPLAVLMHQRWVDFIKGRPLWRQYGKDRTGMIFADESRERKLNDYEDPAHPTMGFILH
ncbi:carboxylesterase/lipase family protein [Chitinophaga ginsengisoli]|uniref:Carboxylic ester hydrolase n=1 Tax=Chitinophaga ginsengisoli TaxID=363837 RepID=A0A2P8FQW4_9BACT|nr:carboxylesterase family protein [Chitinophaga ginsengisoli]PSL24120.1 para-nitrobenzyl esterase [Chitinophaga ginsengisoli]